MKIVSFLGFGKYHKTKYVHPDINHQDFLVDTPFFQEALVEFYKPDTLIILLTRKVETEIPKDCIQTNWQALQNCLATKVNIEPITNIPERGSPEDIWHIFDKITNSLQDGDEVIFDITYGFRSIPIIALLAVSYLRVVRKVNIKGLVYGAFEAKNDRGETPTFDLLPIVSLFDWMTATEQFIKTGSGDSLAKLLEGSSTDLAQDITQISQALELLRPVKLMQEAAKLPDAIKKATPIVSQEFPPFKALLEMVEKDYSQFALSNPQDFLANPKDFLLKLLDIIRWYVDKRQFVQALAAEREWLPCLLCYHFKLDAFDNDDKNRQEMETLLSGGTTSDGTPSKYLDAWNAIEKSKRNTLKGLWSNNPEFKLANLRNDVLHVGFNKKPRDAEAIILKIQANLRGIEAIAKEWLSDDMI